MSGFFSCRQMNKLLSSGDLTPTAGWEVQPGHFGGSLYSKNLLLCDFMTWMSPPMLPYAGYSRVKSVLQMAR